MGFPVFVKMMDGANPHVSLHDMQHPMGRQRPRIINGPTMLPHSDEHEKQAMKLTCSTSLHNMIKGLGMENSCKRKTNPQDAPR